MLGPLLIDIEGFELTPEDREILQHPLVGGIIYFTRNFDSRAQIKELTSSIKALRTPELLVAVDHEGGRVQRFRRDFTVLPAVNTIGYAFDEEAQRGLSYAYQHGWLMASELRAVGIDFSFAPVLDLDYARSEVIGDRAFHHNAKTVGRIAAEYIKGMNDAGMVAIGKHFPGHGWAQEDSHVAIPTDDRDLQTIMNQDMIPYQLLCDDMLAGIMPAHVIYNKIDSLPACFSKIWLQQILREKIGFKGLVISDDLSMHGASIISARMSERTEAALLAGCDMTLICNDRTAVVETIDNLKYVISDGIKQNIERLRGVSAPNNIDKKELKKIACQQVAELTRYIQ